TNFTNVDTKSRLMLGVSTTAGLLFPAQRMIVGSRRPPSYTYPLPPRYGVLCVEGPPANSSTDRPPLSDVKITSDFSSSPKSLIFFRISPTQSSIVSIIAAYVG